uniref:Variant surface glycoprotein n=1 Tax=Trypanosoma brucei TaxID=5691 RepID=A0A1J0R9V7_9TRYP|nr:variant surface glycoprotein 1125.4126 [Trypanosoma brucei]ARB50567.1 variant surface glycoprotein [Trypanosoma brucei]
MASGIATINAPAAVGEVGNRREFQAVCAALALAAGETELAVFPTEVQVAQDALLDLHLYLAGPEFQAYFLGTDKKTAKEFPTKEAERPSGEEWDADKWAAYGRAAVKLAVAGKAADKVTEAGFATLAEGARTVAAKNVADLVNQTNVIIKQLREEQPTSAEVTADAIKQLVNEAAYGVPQGQAQYAQNSPSPDTTSKVSRCTAATLDKSDNTLAAALTCLCIHKEQGSGQTKACEVGAAISGTMDWDTINTGAINTHFQTLKNKCKIGRDIKYAAANIEDIANALEKLIRNHVSDGYLGHYSQNSCDGSSGNGMCVKYTGYTTRGSGGFKKIYWASKLQQAASSMRKQEAKAQTWKSMSKVLQDKVSEAYLSGSQATTLVSALATATKQPTVIATDKRLKKKESECNRHKEPQKCTEPCKWDTEEKNESKKCKLSEFCKEQVENTAAESGDGAAGTTATSGCARHGNDKTACENDKTGDKQNSAFRKDKDKDDKDTKEYLNRSFLVNKKLL